MDDRDALVQMLITLVAGYKSRIAQLSPNDALSLELCVLVEKLRFFLRTEFGQEV